MYLPVPTQLAPPIYIFPIFSIYLSILYINFIYIICIYLGNSRVINSTNKLSRAPKPLQSWLQDDGRVPVPVLKGGSGGGGGGLNPSPFSFPAASYRSGPILKAFSWNGLNGLLELIGCVMSWLVLLCLIVFWVSTTTLLHYY